MIMSMTGYGRGVNRIKDLEVTAEVRSVNNRYLDVILKLPRCLSNYENQIRERVAQHIRRGRVNVWIGLTNGEGKEDRLVINKGLASLYSRLARELGEELDINGTLDINQLLSLPDIIVPDMSEDSDETVWQCAESALNEALTELSQMRRREGEQLCTDFRERLRGLNELIQGIEKVAERRPKEELDRLRVRVRQLVSGENIDEGRLELELAVIAERMDITEECVRFHSHNTLFLEMLDEENAQGRKLNFLLQEMNREANTIGAKAYSAEISHYVVRIKEEVERIREQVQNVE